MENSLSDFQSPSRIFNAFQQLLLRICNLGEFAQTADKLEIPLKYYHKMKSEAPELLAENVNTWLHKTEKDFFIRGLGDSVRVFFSNRYRVIDHLDVLYCSLNELHAHHVDIEDCFLSEAEMNIKAPVRQV